MEWFWAVVIILLGLTVVVLLFRYCRKRLWKGCETEPDYRRNEPYDSSSTPVPIGFTETNQRVPLRPERFSGSMPMPNTSVRSILDPISGSNPYPPISFAASRLNPTAPLHRQHSSSVDDLPPSYNVAVKQERGGSVNMQRPHSAGHVNL